MAYEWPTNGPDLKGEGGSLSRLLIPYIFIGIFLLWRMKHERGMSEVMHLELIVNSIYIHILTVNIFRYRIVVSETSQ